MRDRQGAPTAKPGELPERLKFDPEWYLQSNPDVAGAGLDPWQHYVQAGRAEGRLAAPVLALALDRRLWRGAPDPVLAQLRELTEQEDGVEQGAAGWVLARWYASQGDWEAVRHWIGLFHLHPAARRAVPQPGPFLLAAQAAMKCSSVEEVQHWIERTRQACGAGPELTLLEIGRDRMRPGAAGEAALCQSLNRLYTGENLIPVSLVAGEGSRFDRLTGLRPQPRLKPDTTQPLISVIMPVYQAEATLEQAAGSVLAQDWQRLELLLVEDGSRDGSLAAAHRLAARDARVRVIETGSNLGAYGARNLGMAAAQGAFITVHDADDWSHPSKLRLQVTALLTRPTLQASLSHWVRADDDLEMTRWRIEPEGWVHRNVSSLMIRAELRDRLGYWDRVRFNADTEYYYRIIAAFGAEAIAEICPGVPLAWGRSHAGSLTGRPETHARTHVWGLRNDYMTAARYWQSQAISPDDLYLSAEPAQRPFRVPAGLQPADPPGPETPYDRLLGSGRFDSRWYLEAYADVERSGMAPALHYLTSGMAEDRDPGPEFSASGYRVAAGVAAGQGALFHWLENGGTGSDPVAPVFAGRLARRRGQRVLVCAHAAGEKIFGAERSFIDMLRRLRLRRKIPVVVVPSVRSGPYLDMLLALSAAVVVVPQIWRRSGTEPDPRTLGILSGLIRTYRTKAVHVNTVSLEAPLVAARAEGCESVVYVRELPAQDPPLCQRMEMTPDQLRLALLEQADRFVANSPLVADWLAVPGRTRIVPNRVDRSLFRVKWSPGKVLRAGLISSNIPKKGIGDAVEVGRLLAEAGAPVEVALIGPWTPELNEYAPLPSNMSAPGYAERPADALVQVDVVLSLSHFAESFGRTVLEAMAAGRPVICYDRGMPVRLVRGRGGDLTAGGRVVPADDPAAVAEVLIWMSSHPRQLRRMSRMARLRARWLNRF